MRYLLTILCFFSLSANATNYYIDNAGSDAANGLTTATAWQTLAKINSSSFSSGDSIFLKRGGIWNERLVPPSNGVYFGVYGTGSKPLITGLQTVTGFTNVGNIWTATVIASASLNMVLINGQVAHKGRFPNATNLAYNSKTLSTLVTSLSGTPNYTGATVVVRSAPWTWDLTTVTSQSGGTLNLSPILTYAQPLYSNGFFFQGLASFVDTLNEYDYTGTTLTVYSTTTPTVQISTIDTLVWLGKKSNITFDGISFTGANKAAIQFDTSTLATVQNCSFDYSGTLALSALKSSRLSILNNTITNSLSGGIYARQLDLTVADYGTPINQCDSATVTGNTIRRTGLLAGMGLGGNGRYDAIYVQGLNLGPNISGNIIDSTGYIGINFQGKKSVIRNNVISNFCFVKDDGGGIYSTIDSYLSADYTDSSVVNSNIVYNGIGAPDPLHAAAASGIYLDVYSRKVTMDSNTVYNCALGGLLIDGRLITARYNNLHNNLNNIYFVQYAGVLDSMYITHNSLYSSTSPYLINAAGVTTTMANFGVIDSNYYYNPNLGYNLIRSNATNYTFPAWKTYSSKDISSSEIPTDIVTKALPSLIINSSMVPVTYNLAGTYMANGRTFNSITLPATSSAMVLKVAYNVFNNLPIRFKKLNQ